MKECKKCKVIKSLQDFTKGRLCKQCNCEERKAKYREAKGETAYTIRKALKQQGLKKCTECEEILPLTDFDLQNKNKGNSYRPKCKKCFTEHGQRYWNSVREKYLHPEGKIFKETLKNEGKKLCTMCKEIKELDKFYTNKKTNKILGKCNDCQSNYNKKRKRKENGTAWLISLRENGTKRCHMCLEIKTFENFGFNKNTYDGYQQCCRSCKSQIDKKYRTQKGKILLDKKKEYYERVKHTEQFQSYYKKRQENRDYKKEYQQVRSDDWRRCKDDLRKLMNSQFKHRKTWVRKDTKTEQLLGADFFTVKSFIERQFLVGMTWQNHGKWHLDHVIPLDSANKDKEVLYKLFNYKNLTPVWSNVNLSKSYKIPQICALWANPIVPYKEHNIVFEPTHKGNVGSFIMIEPGTRYGRLTIISESEVRGNNGRRYFDCKCDCGTEKKVALQSLRGGRTKSCGCYHKEVIRKKKG